MMARSVGAFYFLLFTLFPIPAIALAPATLTEVSSPPPTEEQVSLGDYINRQVLACFRKEDLYYVTDPKTANNSRAHQLFKYPYRCAVQVVETILLRYDRRFVGQDGTVFWTIGVGTEPDGEVMFYIALPASTLK